MPHDEAWLGVDLGTLSAKAVVIGPDGRVTGMGRSGYGLDAARLGWAETSPEAWWSAVVAAVRQALAAHEAATGSAARVAALGLSGQMHGVVVTDAAGEPLRPAIVWADSRAQAELTAYRELAPEVLAGLANVPAPGHAGPLLLWLMRHEPATVTRARWALQPKDWLRLRLTGVAASEPSDASATMLFHVEHGRWHAEALAALGIDPGLLAPLAASDAVAGELTADAAAALGLPAGLPVAAGAADTAAAALGNRLRPGDVQLTIGSGAQLVALQPNYAPAVAGADVYRTADARGWYLLLPVHNAGIALEWVLGALGLSWDEAYALAARVASGSEGVSFSPLLGAERAIATGAAGRGAWSGLGLSHGRGHLVRAALEGVAAHIGAAFRRCEQAGLAQGELVLAGGGVGERLWSEMLEASLGRGFRLVPEPAASARGAALLARRAVDQGHTEDD